MLSALESAISALLTSGVPALFAGAGAVALAFAEQRFTVDPMSADPVAGEPGPEDAQDNLAFDPAAPAGPHLLTRPPYAGPKRVYLRSPAGELVPLLPAEVLWSATDAARFTLAPRAGRVLAGFNQLQVLYGVVAAGTTVKTRHQAVLLLTAADAARAGQAQALALAALLLNHEALREAAAFDHSSGRYRCQGTLKSLGFAGGEVGGALQRRLLVSAEIDLRLSRLLDDDEGQPITHIVSAGRPIGSRAIDIDPAVQA